MRGFDLHQNDYVAINGRPYKVVEVSFDGYNKCYTNIVGIDVFTGEKLERQLLSTDLVDTPKVIEKGWKLVNIDEGYLNLVDSEGLEKDDVKVPGGDLGQRIENDFSSGKDLEITILSAMDIEGAVHYRETSEI